MTTYNTNRKTQSLKIKINYCFLLMLLVLSSQWGHSNIHLHSTKAKDVNTILSTEIIQTSVKGVVRDANNIPLIGVTVTVKDKSKGVVTDFDGQYSINVSKGDVLIFSYIGMKTREVIVRDATTIDIVMENDQTALDEVVITGYQNINKKSFTGASQTLKAEKIKLDGIPDAARMLEGRAAGVSVQNITGSFGSAPRITIRGGSSIFGNTKPLWVVDGAVQEEIVDLSISQLASGDPATLISSAIAGLNANDIQSIEVLKDASALSLYGARALNGAIIITTKAGKRNKKTSFTYHQELSMKNIPSYSNYNLLNSQETMEVYRELEQKGYLNYSTLLQASSGGVYNLLYRGLNNYRDDGTFEVTNTPEARNTFLRKYELANTDWFDLLFKKYALIQNHTLSFSGGGESSSQYASIGFYTDPGWTVTDNVSRITANLKNSYDIGDKITAGVLVQGSIRDQKTSGSFNQRSNTVTGSSSRNFDINPFSYALNTSRALRDRDDNGDLEYYRLNYAPLNILNEVNNNHIDINVLDLKIQGTLKAKLYKGLTYNFLGSVRYVQTTQEHKIKENSNVVGAYNANETTIVANNNPFLLTDNTQPNLLPQIVLPNGGIYDRRTNSLQSFYARNSFNYETIISNDHEIKAFLGQEIRFTDRSNSYFRGYGYQYANGGVPFIDYRAIQKERQDNTNYYSKQDTRERGVAFFLKLNYTWKNRYIFSTTGNYEGSNRLGKSNAIRYLPTYNISFKWNATEENFLRSNKLISKLFLRAGYGLIAGLGNATNSTPIYSNFISNRFSSDDRENLISISNLENSDLTWEKVYEANFGLDLGFLNNRFTLSTDIYQKKSFDLIDFVRTSGIGGEYFKTANNADMTTTGLEVTINTTNLNIKDFKWSTNINFSIFNQEITKLKNEPQLFNLVTGTGGNIVGGRRNALYSFDFQGLTDLGLPFFKLKPGDEDPVRDIDFQETENLLDFLKYEGSIEPNVSGGLSNTFTYKNWELSVLITMQAGNKIRLPQYFSSRYSDLSTFPREFLNRWILPGDEKITNVPVILDPTINLRYTSTELSRLYNAYNYSSVRVADGSFVRLKNVSLSYKLPETFTKKIFAKSIKLRTQVTNPLLLYADSKLNGQDPEFFRSGGVALPITTQYTFTLNVSF